MVIEAAKAEAKTEELGNSDGGPVEAAHIDEPSGVTRYANEPPFPFAIKDSFFNSATARSFLSCSDNRLLKIQFLIQLPSVSINTAAVTAWLSIELK